MKTVSLVSISCNGFYSTAIYLLRNYALLDEKVRSNYRFKALDMSVRSNPRVRMYKLDFLNFLSDVYFNFTTRNIRSFISWIKHQLKLIKAVDRTIVLVKWWRALIRILFSNADIIGFSCYIWNVSDSLNMASILKRCRPGAIIVFGGQEVTNTGDEFLKKYGFIDYVVDGEGEETFREFLKALVDNPGKGTVVLPGLVSRGAASFERRMPIADLDGIPSPYLDYEIDRELMDRVRRSKIGCLVETARGCPFKCSFCFESEKFSTVRHFSIDRIASEIIDMSRCGVIGFHILDPILCNSSRQRLESLVSIIEQARIEGGINTSVEVYAELLKEDVIEYLKAFSDFDVGLQSYNPSVLKKINRYFDPDKFENGVRLLKTIDKIISVYLIFGLPGESYFSFIKTIMYAINLNPTKIFVNRLFVLQGTPLRKNAANDNIHYSEEPPYQAKSTNKIDSHEMNLLEELSRSFMQEYIPMRMSEIAKLSSTEDA